MGYLLSLDTTLKLSEDFRKDNKKVVFTHGTFDLFHAGHSQFLNKSKKEGDVLIVCVEPDSNVKKYKSILRPIIGQKQRAEILANHCAVDFVFINKELEEVKDEYYLELYKCLRPKVLTVGYNFAVADRKHYKSDETVLKSIKAEVNSTTKIISAILNKYS